MEDLQLLAPVVVVARSAPLGLWHHIAHRHDAVGRHAAKRAHADLGAVWHQIAAVAGGRDDQTHIVGRAGAHDQRCVVAAQLQAQGFQKRLPALWVHGGLVQLADERAELLGRHERSVGSHPYRYGGVEYRHILHHTGNGAWCVGGETHLCESAVHHSHLLN